MGSVYKPITRMVGRGFDRSKQRHQVSPESCWDALNLRPVLGRLEQTPWVQSFQTMPLYIPSNPYTPVHFCKLMKDFTGNVQYLVLDEYSVWFISPTQSAPPYTPPIVMQTSKPNDATLTGECLLSGIQGGGTNYLQCQLQNIGDVLTVQTLSASTFQWSLDTVAAGAWQGPFAIMQTVVLTGTNNNPFVPFNLSVNFQSQGNPTTDFLNYPVGSTWTWTRVANLPTPTDPTSYNVSYPSDGYATDSYIGAVNRNVFRVRNDVATTVGYTRVFGFHVAVFYQHLFVSQYAPGVYSAGGIVDSYSAATTPFTVGWSHLSNPDQFFSTLINEADQYSIPTQQYYELNNVGITGMAPWRSLLYVFTTDSIQTVQYVGLPQVMQFTPLNSAVGCLFKCAVVRSPFGIYFIGRNDFYVIRLFEAQAVGIKVRSKFFNEIVPYTDPNFERTFGSYNPYSKEVSWTYWIIASGVSGVSPLVYQQRQVVYCEQTDDWYFRNLPCSGSGESDILSTCPMYNTFGQNLYGNTGKLLADQSPTYLQGVQLATAPTSGAIADQVIGTGTGNNFTAPYLETPFLPYGNDPFHVKQDSGLYLDAAWNVGLQLIISRANPDFVGNGTATMIPLSETWNPGIQNKRISTPRDAFRVNAMRFQFDNGMQPVYGGVFNMYQEFILGPTAPADAEK